VRRAPVLLAALALLLAGCGGEDDQDAGTAQDTAAAKAPTAAVCRSAEAPAPRAEGTLEAPRTKLDPGKTHEVTFRTNCGSFTVRLDPRTSPRTTASFASLAEKGFFDGTVFHRIVPGFVIQGGDPTGSGSGGPGYSTRDMPPGDAAYTEGVVAMAKTAQEPPGTAGSQFYVVTGADAGLPPEYAILGKVVKGREVTARIGELGDPASGGSGTPTQPVVIEKATVAAR
jgi:peptidyl-prolyl cis-trans isomerase B (cyclophilin B)